MPLQPQVYPVRASLGFALLVERARPALRRLHREAFEAFATHRAAGGRVLKDIGGITVFPHRRLRDDELVDGSSWATMWVSERLANSLADAMLLLVDDALSAYGRRLRVPMGVSSSFGPVYNGVAFSALVKAATNAIRHSSEWADDSSLPSPTEPKWNAPASEWGDVQRKALASIRTLVGALKLADRVSKTVSIDVLVVVDGHFPARISYDRFEAAFIATALDIACAAGPAEFTKLEEALREIVPRTSAP